VTAEGTGDGGRTSLLVWDVSADQDEPWRRRLQELSDTSREEEYMQSRRRLGISAESVWPVPKPSGEGMAVICLETEDPDRALGERRGCLRARSSLERGWRARYLPREVGDARRTCPQRIHRGSRNREGLEYHVLAFFLPLFTELPRGLASRKIHRLNSV
jgi:hypothetical protein